MYTLDYNTGAGNSQHDTIADAIAAAQPTYTQDHITVNDADGNAVKIARWWGSAYDPDVSEDAPLADFGTFGHYDAWTDCE